MKPSDIEIGAVYLSKVAGRVVKVEVLAKEWKRVYRRHLVKVVREPYWRVRNLRTGREIVVKSAQRFRSRVETGEELTPLLWEEFDG